MGSVFGPTNPQIITVETSNLCAKVIRGHNRVRSSTVYRCWTAYYWNLDLKNPKELGSHPQLPIMKEEISGGPIPVVMDLTTTDDRNSEEQFYTSGNKSENEIVYKCTLCTFHTMYEQYIINHNRLHLHSYKIPEDTFFKCSFTDCNFQTIYKKSFQRHSNIHSDIIHECNKCSFQTKQNEYLKIHKLRVHADSPDTEIFIYKCAYENHFKENLFTIRGGYI
ncbi:hypothetical protein JTB14_011587 [Gonioctena quinquepunctata]|nr:hypothetical protein JTB14_011587 [Gonioctena quinquepunctata]